MKIVLKSFDNPFPPATVALKSVARYCPLLDRNKTQISNDGGRQEGRLKRDVCLGTLNISNYENNMRHTHRPVGLLCFLICALYDSWCLSCRIDEFKLQNVGSALQRVNKEVVRSASAAMISKF